MKTKRILMVLLIAVMALAMTVSFAFADGDDYKKPDMTNVTGIEFRPADELILEELVDGSYDMEEEYDDVFYYSLWRKIEKDGSVLILVNKDGSRSEFVFDRSEYTFIGKDGYGIDSDYIEYDYMQRQRKEPWGLGKHTFALEYGGFKCELTATVVENSIAAMEYIPAKPYEFIEYGDGWWKTDSDGNQYFDYYYRRIQDKDSIRLTMKDGTVKTYVYEYDEDYDDEYLYFRCKEDGTSISSQNIFFFDDQEQNHWVKGGNYYVTFKYADKEYKIPVTIVDSPVESIAYEPVSPITYTENVEGYMEEDKDGNEYFEYYEPEPEEGDKLIVVQDGTSKTYVYSDDEGYFICGDDSIRRYDVDFDSNQGKKHWTPGADNELTVRYLGRECKVPVTIEENKVKEIAYEPAKPYEYDELDSEQGYWDEGYDDDSYFYYELPGMAEGDKLTVTTDEGSKEYIYDGDEYKFVSKDGDTIGSRDVRFSSGQYRNHWEPDKENYMEVEYMAKECLVPVVIHANPENVRKHAVSSAESLLEGRVARAERRKDEFTEKSFKAMEDAADAVRALLADDRSTAEQISTATAALKRAYYDLEELSDEELQKLREEAVKAAKAAIGAFNKLDKSQYTEESYNKAAKAADDLNEVLADGEDAYITTIKTSTAALTDAISALKVIQRDNPVKVTAVNKTFKAKNLKKKAATFKAVTVKKAEGKLTYSAKATGKSAKALRFNKKTAKITVKKGTKKGKYTIKVTVKAAGSKYYKPATVTKTVKVTVK